MSGASLKAGRFPIVELTKHDDGTETFTVGGVDLSEAVVKDGVWVEVDHHGRLNVSIDLLVDRVAVYDETTGRTTLYEGHVEPTVTTMPGDHRPSRASEVGLESGGDR